MLKKILMLISVWALMSSCSSNASNAYTDSSTTLSFKVQIPGLPDGWRLPYEDELDHIMRPKEQMLFPNYLDAGELDFDGKLDWVVLVVSIDEELEAAMVFLSSKEKWFILDKYPVASPPKIGMRVKILESKVPSISYSKMGSGGYYYYWNEELAKFTKSIKRREQ